MKNDLELKSSLYPRLFNDLIADLGLNQSLPDELLVLFSNVKAALKMYPDSEELLLALKKQRIKLGLITNGNVNTQKKRLNFWGLNSFLIQ